MCTILQARCQAWLSAVTREQRQCHAQPEQLLSMWPAASCLHTANYLTFGIQGAYSDWQVADIEQQEIKRTTGFHTKKHLLLNLL
jgi:hypothetical protein